MSFSQPDPPDPYATAQAQAQFNLGTAQQQYGMYPTQVATPGSQINYTGLGTPNATVKQTYSPQQQKLFAGYQRAQLPVNQAAQGLTGAFPSTYKDIPDFAAMSSPLVQAQMGAFRKYMQPQWDVMQTNLDSKLENQGMPQGSQGWVNAQRPLQQMINQSNFDLLTQVEPQAFQQAITQYGMPIQTAAGLLGIGAPQGLTPPNVPQPPTMQPPPYAQLAEQNYAQQNQQFMNTMQGLSTLGSAGIAGLFGLGRGPSTVINTAGV